MLIETKVTIDRDELEDVVRGYVTATVGLPPKGYHYFVEIRSWGDAKVTTEKDADPVEATPATTEEK